MATSSRAPVGGGGGVGRAEGCKANFRCTCLCGPSVAVRRPGELPETDFGGTLGDDRLNATAGVAVPKEDSFQNKSTVLEDDVLMRWGATVVLIVVRFRSFNR